jgi:NAD(P)-dependent dehydrogenase (short-subunit alcohol dehydrogenase family)
MAQEPTDVPAIPDYQRLLDGKVAVVTGGRDGIGGAISRLFAEHGARVEIAEIDPERAAAKQAEIEAAGGTARARFPEASISACFAAARSGSISAISTIAPCSAKRVEMAPPIPSPPPVTTATLPSSSRR